MWYAEKKDWKGGVVQAQNTQVVGHYTQVSDYRRQPTKFHSLVTQQTDRWSYL